jgi:hypothetical protein
MSSTREERPRRRPLGRFIGLPLGLLFLAIGLNRPTIANMRTVDLIYLLATGACLGAGLLGVVLHFVGRREAEAARFGRAIAIPAAKRGVPKTPDSGTRARVPPTPRKRPREPSPDSSRTQRPRLSPNSRAPGRPGVITVPICIFSLNQT